MPSATKVYYDTWHLANLGIFIKYKVKDGDSIKSVAESIGLTWQELARFNWGTDVPDEINWYLKNFFVCTKKTADGVICVAYCGYCCATACAPAYDISNPLDTEAGTSAGLG